MKQNKQFQLIEKAFELVLIEDMELFRELARRDKVKNTNGGEVKGF